MPSDPLTARVRLASELERLKYNTMASQKAWAVVIGVGPGT